MTNIQNILCPIDFSPPSQKALDYATFLAKQFQANLQLLHVIEPLVSSMLMGHALQMAAQVEAELEEQAKKELSKIAQNLNYTKLSTKTLRGNTFAEILEEAQNADLIVLGTHGRSGLSHLLLGSVAERVVRKAPCPVLTVK